MTAESGIGPLSVTSFQPAGAPSGPPVLLLHSFPSDSASDWPGWADALNAAGRAAHLVDLPGHGASPSADSGEAATTSRIVAAITAVIDGLGSDEIDVIGYSLGARLAWELPAASKTPVRRLVLGGIGPADPFRILNIAEVEAFAADGTQPSDPFTGQIMGFVAGSGQNAAGVARTVAGLAREPFAPSTGNAPRVPTLFVVGDQDHMMADGLDRLVALVPNARRVNVPGDHRGALLGPEFRATALEFLTAE